jgi:hypothetical protein
MLHRALCIFPLIALLLTVPVAAARELPLRLTARSIDLAESLPDGATIGRVRVRGMLELPTLDVGKFRFAELSALAWDDDDGVLYALSDKGMLFHLQPAFTNGNLSGVTLLKSVVLADPKRGKPLRSWLADSEGMDILNGRNGRAGDAELLVSFEHTPRIFRYRPDGTALAALALPPALADANDYRGANRMLEAVCHDPALGVLTTPEFPLDDDIAGSTRIFSLSGKTWRYPVTGEFRITAIECLGDGRLLVLERDFNVTRSAVSLRLVTLPPTPTPELLAPTTVVTLNASDGYQIDNFEGLTRHKGNTFFIVSDDNDLFVQRTLLLYVELLPEPPAATHR